MAHQDSAGGIYRSNRPPLGVRVPDRGEMMIGNFEDRDYRDQVRYNTAKWEVAERVIAEFQRSHMFDFGVIEIVEGVIAKLPAAIARAKKEWDEGQLGKTRKTRFSKSYPSFKTLFAELRTAISLSHDARHNAVIAQFIHQLSALSHNEYSAAELGFTEQTPAEKEIYVDAIRDEKDETRRAKIALQNRLDDKRRETNVRAFRRANPRILSSQTTSTTPASTGSPLGQQK